MQEILLYAVALPLGVAVGVVGVAGWLHAGEADSSKQRMASGDALAFTTAYLVCHLGLHGTPAGTQLESWEWLLLLVPLAGVLAVADAYTACTWKVRLLAALCFAVLCGWLLVPSFQESPLLWGLGLATSVVALVLSQQRAVRRLSIGPLLVSWVLVGASGVPVLIASANAKFGFFCTAVSAAAGGAFLVRLFPSVRDRWKNSGAILVTSVAFPGILANGHFNNYGEVPVASFVLLALAPLGLLVGVFVSLPQARTWVSVTCGLGSVIAVCVAALWLSWPAITSPAY